MTRERVVSHPSFTCKSETILLSWSTFASKRDMRSLELNIRVLAVERLCTCGTHVEPRSSHLRQAGASSEVQVQRTLRRRPVGSGQTDSRSNSLPAPRNHSHSVQLFVPLRSGVDGVAANITTHIGITNLKHSSKRLGAVLESDVSAADESVLRTQSRRTQYR